MKGTKSRNFVFQKKRKKSDSFDDLLVWRVYFVFPASVFFIEFVLLVLSLSAVQRRKYHTLQVSVLERLHELFEALFSS